MQPCTFCSINVRNATASRIGTIIDRRVIMNLFLGREVVPLVGKVQVLCCDWALPP